MQPYRDERAEIINAKNKERGQLKAELADLKRESAALEAQGAEYAPAELAERVTAYRGKPRHKKEVRCWVGRCREASEFITVSC